MESPAPPLLVRIPAPVYVLVYLGLALVLARLLPEQAGAGFVFPPVGITFVGASVILAQWAILLFVLDKTTINPAATMNSVLVQAGPYRFTRNPMYLSLVLACVGIALMVGHWPLYAVPFAVFATISCVFIPYEEAQMERQFGDHYRAYKAKVRRWL